MSVAALHHGRVNSNAWRRAGAPEPALNRIAVSALVPRDGPGGPVMWAADGRAAWCMPRLPQPAPEAAAASGAASRGPGVEIKAARAGAQGDDDIAAGGDALVELKANRRRRCAAVSRLERLADDDADAVGGGGGPWGAAAGRSIAAAAVAAAVAAAASAPPVRGHRGGGDGAAAARTAAFVAAGRVRGPYDRVGGLSGAGAAAVASDGVHIFGACGSNVALSGDRVTYAAGRHGSGSWVALRPPARVAGVSTARLALDLGRGDVWVGVAELPLPPDAHPTMARRAWVVNLASGFAYAAGRVSGCVPGWDASWARREVVDVIYDRDVQALRIARGGMTYDACDVLAGDALRLVMSFLVCPNEGNSVRVLYTV